MTEKSATPDPLRAAEWVAARLGISRWAVYELAKRGELPCVRLGRTIRFDAAAIETFIRRGGTTDDDLPPLPAAIRRLPANSRS